MTAKPAHRYALPPGHQLGKYRIEEYLGAGAFGITYAAHDERLGRRVAIKEYFPSDLAVRDADDSVAVKTARDEDDYRWGLSRFADEARALARFRHPNIVGVYDYFTAHASGYLVMEYVQGETLGELLRRKGTLTEAEIESSVLPVLPGLEQVHGAGLLHRDIKPGNVVLRGDGTPVLIDFGAARQVAGTGSRSVTSLVTPGYSPLEQYSTTARQTPATDVYAISAVLYRCVTGNAPADATDRSLGTAVASAGAAAKRPYSMSLLQGIDGGLALRAANRHQSIADFRACLETATGPSVGGRVDDLADRASASEPDSAEKRGARRAIGTVLGIVLAGIGLLVIGSLPWDRAAVNALGGEHAPEGLANGGRKTLTPEQAPRDPGLTGPGATVNSDAVETGVQDTESVPNGAFGTLTLDLVPPDARVTLPDLAVAYEPNVRLPEGSHLVVVTKEGYRDLRRIIPVLKGTHVPVELERIMGPFTISVAPRTATVDFVGMDKGYRPAMPLKPGTYRVRVSAPGYVMIEEEVSHGDDVTNHTISLRVAPQPFTITTSPPTAQVRLRNELLSYQPGVELPPGTYKIDVTEDWYRPFAAEIEHVAIPGRPTERHVELRLLWEPGYVFRDCDECPQIAVVPSNDDHESFGIGVYEVKHQEFARFVAETGREPSKGCWFFQGDTGLLGDGLNWRSPGFSQTSEHPAVCVSWLDAEAYVLWLSALTGEYYRLPTDSEWGYAATARAGYPLGTEAQRACVYGSRSAARSAGVFSECGRRFANPRQVGYTGPSGFGLFDVHANVWEWTHTCNTHDEKTSCVASDVRGLLWRATPWKTRSPFTIGYLQDFRYTNLGFRVARALRPTGPAAPDLGASAGMR